VQQQDERSPPSTNATQGEPETSGCAQQQDERSPSSGADAGEEAAPLDDEQLSKDMEAVRDELKSKLERNLRAQWSTFYTTPAPEKTPWTHGLSGDAEALLVLSPTARERVLNGWFRDSELELGLAFVKHRAPNKEGWSGAQGYWAKWFYVPRASNPNGGPAIPARFELRVPGAPGTPDTAIARGPVMCQGCDNPALPGLIAAKEKPTVRLTLIIKPQEETVIIDVEWDWGRPKDGGKRVLVHMAAPLTLEPVPTTLSARTQESALGLPFLQAVDGAKLTKADAARTAVSSKVQKKWLPANLRLKLDDLAGAPIFLQRNRDVGDLDGDGVEEYVHDFVHWAPFKKVGADGAAVPLKLEETDLLGLFFFSLPDLRGQDCPSCSRPGMRGFYTLRLADSPSPTRFHALRLSGPGTGADIRTLDFAWGRLTSQSQSGKPWLGVSSLCLFEDEPCDVYEAGMQVDGAELVIKTKSSPP
jgi:hypothetical protein